VLCLLKKESFGQPNFMITDVNHNKLKVILDEQRDVVSYGIVIDTSAKMDQLLPTAVQLVKSIIGKEQLKGDFFITDAKDTNNIDLLKDFKDTFEQANKALNNLSTRGHNSLLDAIVVSGEYLKVGTNKRKILIVISHGQDGSNKYSLEETISTLKKAHIEVYVIKLGDSKGERQFGNFEEKRTIKLVDILAKRTNGKAYFLSDSKDTNIIVQKLMIDITKIKMRKILCSSYGNQ
jgi:hypothetical protein